MATTACELMTQPPSVVHRDAQVGDAVRLLLDEFAPQLDVVDGEGQLVGSVPDNELLKAQMEGNLDRPVSSLMNGSALRIDVEMSLEFVAGLFRDGRYRRLPVIERGYVVGQIDRRDVMRLLRDRAALAEAAQSGEPGASATGVRRQLQSLPLLAR